MDIYTAAQMIAADHHAITCLGLPGAVLMETAGRCCARVFAAEFAARFPARVLVLAGKGNNGGDGYVIARLLADRGWPVTTLVVADENTISGDAALMLRVLRNCGGEVVFAGDEASLRRQFVEADARLIVDAVFGTGLQDRVRGLGQVAIELINSSGVPVLAVDMPSGVDASTGRICGSAVRADVTVTFDHAKIGHVSDPGAGCVGRLEVVDIGIPRRHRPESCTTSIELIDAEAARRRLPRRSADGHKGRFGHLLLVAGSPGKTGAAALAANAAVRSGCGLVTAVVPASLNAVLEVKLTEAMTVPAPDAEGLLTAAAEAIVNARLEACQVLAVGPGLGQSRELRQLVRQLVVTGKKPVVVDADGLNLLAGQLDCLKAREGAPLVLTPHPGEMSRLTGLSVAEIEENRFCVARDFAVEYGVVLLLKGARTLVAAPDGRVSINSSGNSGLAAGGSGDVLTGLLGGLLAQGCDGYLAAGLAAFLHGRSAELIAAQRGVAGMTATELIDGLPAARHELEKGILAC